MSSSRDPLVHLTSWLWQGHLELSYLMHNHGNTCLGVSVYRLGFEMILGIQTGTKPLPVSVCLMLKVSWKASTISAFLGIFLVLLSLLGLISVPSEDKFLLFDSDKGALTTLNQYICSTVKQCYLFLELKLILIKHNPSIINYHQKEENEAGLQRVIHFTPTWSRE